MSGERKYSARPSKQEKEYFMFLFSVFKVYPRKYRDLWFNIILNALTFSLSIFHFSLFTFHFSLFTFHFSLFTFAQNDNIHGNFNDFLSIAVKTTTSSFTLVLPRHTTHGISLSATKFTTKSTIGSLSNISNV